MAWRAAFVLALLPVLARAEELVTTQEPLPNKSYLRLEPTYTFLDGGGWAGRLHARGVVVYRGWWLPRVEAERVSSALRLDLSFERAHTTRVDATGLTNLEVLEVSGVRFRWGAVGSGVTLVLPTATVGSRADAPQLGAALFGQVRSIPHVRASLLVRSFFAVPGTRELPANFSVKLKPAISVRLPARFMLASDGEIEIDWRADRSRVPVNLRVGRHLGRHVLVQAGPELDVAGIARGSVTLDLRIDYIE